MTNYESISLWIAGVEAFAAIAIPVVLAIVSLIVSRRLRGIEMGHKTEQQAVERRHQAEQQSKKRRLLRYEDLTRLANDFYCFSVLVGHYLELTPESMIARKREFESIVFTTLPLWDQQFVMSANRLLSACFVTQRGRNKRPLLTSDFTRHREEQGAEECADWEDYFLSANDRHDWISSHFNANGDKRSYRKDILMPVYAEFLACAARAIGHERDAADLLLMLRGEAVPKHAAK